MRKGFGIASVVTALVWAAVILAAGQVVSYDAFPRLLQILGGGAAATIILLGGLAAQQKRVD